MIDRLRASDPFADEAQFGQLDLSGCPSFFEAELAEQENRKDPFESADYSGADKHGLKDFLRGIDSDDAAIADAACLPGADPAIVSDHFDRVATRVGEEFKTAVGNRYIQCDENLQALVDLLCLKYLRYLPSQDVEENVSLLQSKGFWTKNNLVAAFAELWTSGQLPVYPDGTAKPLTAEEVEYIQRTAQTGNVFEAIVYGLKCSLGLKNTSQLVIDHCLTNPANRELVDGLVMLVFTAIEPGFDAREIVAFKDFALEYAGDRPLTLPICGQAYRAFVQEKRSTVGDKTVEPSQSEPRGFEPQDFDELSDAELETLRVAVLRERAKSK